MQKENTGGSFNHTKTRFRRERIVAIEESVHALLNECQRLMLQAPDEEEKFYSALLRTLAKVFWISYLLQAKEDIVERFGVDDRLIINHLAPRYEINAMVQNERISLLADSIRSQSRYSSNSRLLTMYFQASSQIHILVSAYSSRSVSKRSLSGP